MVFQSKVDRHLEQIYLCQLFSEYEKLDPKRALYFYLKQAARLRLNTDGTPEDKVSFGGKGTASGSICAKNIKMDC